MVNGLYLYKLIHTLGPALLNLLSHPLCLSQGYHHVSGGLWAADEPRHWEERLSWERVGWEREPTRVCSEAQGWSQRYAHQHALTVASQVYKTCWFIQKWQLRLSQWILTTGLILQFLRVFIYILSILPVYPASDLRCSCILVYIHTAFILHH